MTQARKHIEDLAFHKKQIAALRKEREWRDIASAPRDYTSILTIGFVDGKYAEPIVAFYDKSKEKWMVSYAFSGDRLNGFYFETRPIKWMPLTPKPKNDTIRQTTKESNDVQESKG